MEVHLWVVSLSYTYYLNNKVVLFSPSAQFYSSSSRYIFIAKCLASFFCADIRALRRFLPPLRSFSSPVWGQSKYIFHILGFWVLAISVHVAFHHARSKCIVALPLFRGCVFSRIHTRLAGCYHHFPFLTSSRPVTACADFPCCRPLSFTC